MLHVPSRSQVSPSCEPTARLLHYLSLVTSAEYIIQREREYTYAEKVVVDRVSELQAKREEERKHQMDIESSQKQEGTINRGYLPTEDTRDKVVPKWSDVFGNGKATSSNRGSSSAVKERPQELLRKAPASYMRPALVKAPPDCRAEMPVNIPPHLTQSG